jgi:hypothetical protein
MTSRELNDYNAKWLKLATMIKLGMSPVQIDYSAEWDKLAKTSSNKKQPACYIAGRKTK